MFFGIKRREAGELVEGVVEADENAAIAFDPGVRVEFPGLRFHNSKLQGGSVSASAEHDLGGEGLGEAGGFGNAASGGGNGPNDFVNVRVAEGFVANGALAEFDRPVVELGEGKDPERQPDQPDEDVRAREQF